MISIRRRRSKTYRKYRSRFVLAAYNIRPLSVNSARSSFAVAGRRTHRVAVAVAVVALTGHQQRHVGFLCICHLNHCSSTLLDSCMHTEALAGPPALGEGQGLVGQLYIL